MGSLQSTLTNLPSMRKPNSVADLTDSQQEADRLKEAQECVRALHAALGILLQSMGELEVRDKEIRKNLESGEDREGRKEYEREERW